MKRRSSAWPRLLKPIGLVLLLIAELSPVRAAPPAPTADLQEMRERNERSWAAYQKFLNGEVGALAIGAEENRRALQVAESTENPTAVAWCRLQQALILEAQNQKDEAWPAASGALAEFDRQDFLEGQTAAHIVLGRLAAGRGDRSRARDEFEIADRQLPGVVPVMPSSGLPLDAAWQASERSLGKLWAVRSIEMEQQVAAVRIAKQNGDWPLAGQCHRKALEIAREIYGPWHPAVIDAWSNLGQMAWCRGDFLDALTTRQQACEIAEKLYDESDPRFGALRMNLEVSEEFGRRSAAEQQMIMESVRAANHAGAVPQQNAATMNLWNEAVARSRAALGDEHLFTALTLLGRAAARRELRDFTAALEDYQRGAALFSRAGKENHSDYLAALVEIASLQTEQAFSLITDEALKAAMAAQEQVVRKQALKVEAGAANEYLRALRFVQNQPPDVRQRIQQAWKTVHSPPPGQRFLEEFEKGAAELEGVFESESELIIGLRTALATRYRRAGRLDEAQSQLTLARQAWDLRKAPAGRPIAGDLYLEQVVVSLERGEMRAAEEALRTALAAWMQMRRDASATYLTLLRRSVWLHTELADYPHAEIDAWRAVLLCQRRLLPPDHPAYASSSILQELSPELLKQKSAVVRFLQSILDLGEVHQAAGLPQSAKQDFETVLALTDQLDSESAEFLRLNSLRKLGWAERELGDWQRSAELLRTALTQEALHGTETFYYADTADQLAIVLQLQKNLDEASKQFDAAVSGNPRSRTDVRWAGAWKHRAGCQAETNDFPGALESIDVALRLYDRRLTDVSSFRVGRRTWQARNDLLQPFQYLLTLTLGMDRQTDAVERAWNWSMRIKGRALGSLMRGREMQRKMADSPETARMAHRCVQIANEISDLALNPPANLSPAVATARMERLQGELDGLLGNLNRLAALSGETRPEPTLAELKSRLPEHTALIEFVRTPLCRWHEFGRREFQTPDHYLAFVLPAAADAQPKIFDLGEATEIDEAIQDVRKLIKSLPEQLKSVSEKFAEQEYKTTSGELYRLIFGPMERHLAGADVIYAVPDGELQRVAFETLADRSGRYLVENRKFAYPTSTLDLLRPAAPPGNGTWVFANPEYGSPGEPSVNSIENANPVVEKNQADRTSRAEIEDVERGDNWEPLKFTVEELNAVRKILSKTEWGPVHAFEGQQASEAALKSLRSPRVLHLATHGFFVKDVAPIHEDGTRAVGASVGYRRLLGQKNPFLRSGLVLAGANRLKDQPSTEPSPSEDGWVTAEEIATLDLAGTELVVLSACETGLGDVKTGEGVHGLRQALLYAGAKAVITSLYRVSDAGTGQLMEKFYERLTKSSRPLESLHAADLQMIEMRRTKHGAAHPYYWGSFVFVGNPQ